MSTFAYVGANPLSFMDPRGLVRVCVNGVCSPDTSPPIYDPWSDRFSPAQPIAWPKLLPDSWVDWIIEQCTSNNCPPCKTVSGKVVPVGTIAYRPMDTPPAGKVEHGITGPHYNIYKANQNPKNCQCFWQSQGAVAPANLPPGAIPIEAFAN